MSEWIVETRELTKMYGPVESLVDCNLQIPIGGVFGLLGPNGAGKTTLLRLLLGFQKPTCGAARVVGYDVVKQSLLARRNVTYLPGEARLPRASRGRQLIDWFSGLHPYGSREGALAVAKRLDLDLSRHVMFMSTGMRQKLALAIVLGCQAPLVVLDEPTANLDPNVRGEVVELVKQVRQAGRSVVISSHIFSDIDDACDRVAILRGGRVVAEQELSQMSELHLVRARLLGHVVDGLQQQPPAFLEFVCRKEGSAGGDEMEDVELQLSGPVDRWLAWLGTLGAAHMSIDRAGIRALYQRFH